MLSNGSILSDTYRIIEEIGSGGGGIVYKAYHERLQTYVVVKKIKESVKNILESRAEADILKNIKHTYLPRVYDFLEIDDEVFTVMDFIPGSSLDRALSKNRVYSQKTVLKWAVQLSEALAYLHSQNPPIIHSDIKPANIMLTPKGDICLIDFNISLAFDSGMKTSTGISGGYSPPEQYSDINNYRSFTQFKEPVGPKTEVLTEVLIEDSVPKRVSSGDKTEFLFDETGFVDDKTGVAGGKAGFVAGEIGFADDKTEFVADETGIMDDKTEFVTDGTELLRDGGRFTANTESETERLIEGLVGNGVDERSDVYSLGATLHHLLTGVKPGHDFGSITPISARGGAVSEGLSHIIEKSMQLLPQNRYQNGGELLYVLQHIVELDSRYQGIKRKQKMKRLVSASIFVLAFVLAGSGILTMDKERKTAYNRGIEIVRASIETGSFDAARTEISQTRELIPDRIDSYEEEAKLLYFIGDYDGCIDYCRDIINNPPYGVGGKADEEKLGNILFVLGNAYFEKSDFGNAKTAYERAIQYNQTNALYFRDYSITFAKLGDVGKAEELLSTAIDYGLGEDSIYMVQGEIAFSKGNYAEAEQHFQEVIAAAETDTIKRRAILLCAKTYQRLGSGYLDKEIRFLENAESSLGASAGLHIAEQLGDAYGRKAKADPSAASLYYEKALQKFNELFQNGYTTFQVMENIAILYQQINDFEGAETMLKTIEDQYPDNYKVYKRLAFLEADRQQRKSNSQRSYSSMKNHYNKAKALYKNVEQRGETDTEMQMLDRMMQELQAGGWF